LKEYKKRKRPGQGEKQKDSRVPELIYREIDAASEGWARKQIGALPLIFRGD
jgi:hypothetical protein